VALLSFAPLFLTQPAHASCVSSYESQVIAAAELASESTEAVVRTIETCGGDDTSYQVPITTTVMFDGVEYSSVYATTNSVITFGRPDGTYWTYPNTPSISLYSFDWVVYPQWRTDEHLIIRSSDGGFQVDISARPIWLQNATEPTRIVITAAILSDGTVAMAYTLNGPEYPEYNPRTGVRLNSGEIVDFETPPGARFFHGADWGFATDPTALVRVFIKDNCLYIDKEAYGLHVEIVDTPKLFDRIDTARKWPIKADCARPELISYMKQQGFDIKAAKKWAGSVMDGITFMRSFDKIYIKPDCTNTAQEFRLYSYKVDNNSGDILPIITDKYNHIIDAIRYSLDGYIRNKSDINAPQVSAASFGF
jgi:hypothetical protein